MTQLFKEQLISASLASSKCYQKCAHKPGNLKTADACKSKWFNVDSRYCPEEDPFTACQVQCFTTQNTGNRERMLIGKMALPQYQVSVQHVLRDSLHHYYEYGNAMPSMGQTVGSGDHDILALDGKLTSNVTALSLPVCYSTTVRLAEFDNKPHFGHKYNLNQQFPCSCGDWRSSETAEFLSRMGLGSNQTDFTSGAAWELFTQICPHVSTALHINTSGHGPHSLACFSKTMTCCRGSSRSVSFHFSPNSGCEISFLTCASDIL